MAEIVLVPSPPDGGSPTAPPLTSSAAVPATSTGRASRLTHSLRQRAAAQTSSERHNKHQSSSTNHSGTTGSSHGSSHYHSAASAAEHKPLPFSHASSPSLLFLGGKQSGGALHSVTQTTTAASVAAASAAGTTTATTTTATSAYKQQTSAWISNLLLSSSPSTRLLRGGRDRSGRNSEDPLGDKLTQLLNRHPAFSGRPQPHSSLTRRRNRTSHDSAAHREEDDDFTDEHDIPDGFRYPPLVTRHNFRVLKLSLQKFVREISQSQFPFPTGTGGSSLLSSSSSSSNDITDRFRPSRYGQVIFVVWTLILGTGALVVSSHLVLRSVTITLYRLLGVCLLLLFDVQDILSYCCPDWVWKALEKLQQLAQWIDAYLLQGRRFAGREWNQQDYLFHDPAHLFYQKEAPATSTTIPAVKNMYTHPTNTNLKTLANTSRDRSLWELPPPAIKQGRRLCLSWEHFITKEEWSRSTVDHMVAVNFCYVMLREENLRKQASWSLVKRNMNKNNDNNCAAINHDHHDRPFRSSRPSSTNTIVCDSLDGTSRSVTVVMVEDQKHFYAVPKEHGQRPLSPGSEAIELKMSITSNNGHPTSPSSPLANHEVTHTVISSPSNNNFDSADVADYLSDTSIASNLSDLPWIDVGAKIGMRLLNSAHVHRAMSSQEAHDRIMNMGGNFEAKRILLGGAAAPAEDSKINNNNNNSHLTVSPAGSEKRVYELNVSGSRLPKPIHSMWTSPGAAASSALLSLLSDNEESQHGGASGGESSTLSSMMRSNPGSPCTMSHPGSPFAEGSLSPNLSPMPGITMSPFALSSTQGRGRQSRPNVIVSPPFHTNRLNGVSGNPEVVPAIPDLRQLSPPRVKRTASRSRTLSYGGKSEGGSEHCGKIRDETSITFGGEASGRTNQLSLLRRQPLQKGVKVAVPIFPIQPKSKGCKRRWNTSQFQMGTVVSSQRIFVGDQVDETQNECTNCLTVTVKLDRAFLRNADFAEMSFRVMDEWSARYMPKCSKVPIGSCVATTFGVGVLVGWRVEDDIHVVRSLWQRRGFGSAHAYLNRNAIHSTLEAAVGFDVNTRFGSGVVLAYVDGGRTFQNGRYFVAIKEDGRHHGHVLGIQRKDIVSCHGAHFIPIIEHIREAATYQIQVDTYQASLREQQFQESDPTHEKFWNICSTYADILWKSFLKAVEEDKDFDEGMNEFIASIIDFLEKLDESSVISDDTKSTISDDFIASDFEVECVVLEDGQPKAEAETMEPGFWVINDILGGVFRSPLADMTSGDVSAKESSPAAKPISEKTRVSDELEITTSKNYKRAFSLIRTLMKTVSVAQASSADHPHFRMAMAISYDFLLFVRTLLKVQRKNLPIQSIEIWKRALGEIGLTFGPIKDRLEKIGRGIAQRMEKQGRKAKIRVLQFVDIVVGDEKLLFALEQGEWDLSIARLEIALVKSKIIPEESLFYYRKTAQFVLDHIQSSATGSAAARNNEKLAVLAQLVQSIASPRRSILKVFRRDEVLELFERILVRVFCKEEKAARTLTIHAANFHSLRHLRMLKNFSVSGGIWIPLLDAADEEFSWLVSHMPDNSKEFMCPLSSLFSLCVAQFHKIGAGDLSKDWLDFLLEDDAVRIIQDLNMKLILALESFSRDLREMIEVLPYYPR